MTTYHDRLQAGDYLPKKSKAAAPPAAAPAEPVKEETPTKTTGK